MTHGGTTVVRILFGSQLYGTSTPASDYDYKSVYVPCARDILLQRVKDSTGHVVRPKEGVRNAPGAVDDEAYSLQRYLSLLAEGQTVAIDMLFAPEPLMSSPLWKEIRANKARLLTKKSAAFVGYCRTQANKYGIKGSRVAAAKQATEFFSWARGAYGEQAKVADVIGDYAQQDFGEHTRFVGGGTEDRPETFFECCNRKCALGNTVKAAHEMYSRVYQEYGDRARLAESNEGIDWKALSHAVRVGHEALDLLRHGEIVFPLVDREKILAIKLGQVPYADVAKEIESLLEEVEAASKVSTLRDEPDYAWIDNLVVREYRRSVEGTWFSDWAHALLGEDTTQ